MSDEDDDLRDAATLIPIRKGESGLEVFMVRRHSDSGFMADRYVYPGGVVEAGDCGEGAPAITEGRTRQELAAEFGDGTAPERALGHYLAAVRETFEEAGVLMAREAGLSRYVDLGNSERAERLQAARAELDAEELTLPELLEREGLVIPLRAIVYFAHWITPPTETRRYDTRFFVARAPEGQTALPDERETTDGRWLEPGEALEYNRDEKILLAPPTLRTLQILAEFDLAQEALEFARQRRPRTQLPFLDVGEGEITLRLPRDPEYPAQQPPYDVSEPFDEGPERFRMVAPGRWREPPPEEGGSPEGEADA